MNHYTDNGVGSPYVADISPPGFNAIRVVVTGASVTHLRIYSLPAGPSYVVGGIDQQAEGYHQLGQVELSRRTFEPSSDNVVGLVGSAESGFCQVDIGDRPPEGDGSAWGDGTTAFVAICAPTPPATTTAPRCEEDEPCWRCEAMGNRICGPTVEVPPAPPVAPPATIVSVPTPETLPVTGLEGPTAVFGGLLVLAGLVARLNGWRLAR